MNKSNPVDQLATTDRPLSDLTRDEERYVRLMLRMLKSGLYSHVEVRVHPKKQRLILKGQAMTEYHCQ